MSSELHPGVNVDISNGIATITYNRPDTLNAIRAEDYNDFAEALYAIDKRADVYVTIWQATGRMFCAGTDINHGFGQMTLRENFIHRVARANTDTTRALATHSKLLVAALHGPVIGIAAAFLGQFDFIYALPKAYLFVPFTFLGIIAEAGSSVTFARRMGVAKANEVLIFSKKMGSQELVDCGFVNKIFPEQSVESFHAVVRAHVLSELDNLELSAVLKVKQLLKLAEKETNDPDAVILRESYAQAERIATGIPDERFNRIRRKELRHKL